MTSTRGRIARLAAAVAWTVALSTAPAMAADAAAPGANPSDASPGATSAASVLPGVQAGSDGLTVLGQSPWVESAGDFRLQLAITAANASDERLVVQGHGRLTTRTAFDDALAGRFDTSLAYPPPPVPLSSLAHDPNGGVDVDIPVNQNSASGDLPEFTASTVGGSGVYPLQIFLANSSGVQQGQSITSFLVFAAGTAKQTGLPSLSVSVVLPVHAAPAVDRSGAISALSAASSTDLSDLVNALASDPTVPVSLAVTPQTLDALGSGGPGDKSTLAELAAVARAGADQVLPATYAEVPMSGMVANGLASELSRQISAGSAELAGGLLGSPPQPGTWVVNQPLDQATLQLLEASGARRLIVPAGQLSALPFGYQQFTFASPGVLTGDGAPIPVYGADTGLTADFTNPGGPVLAASQLLAELAMIQLETPGNTRGVAVLPPAGWSPDPVFVRTLLAGLQGHPLLRAVSATQLFSVPAPAPPVNRSLAAPLSAPPSTAPPSTAAGSGSPASSTAGPATSTAGAPAAAAGAPSGQALAAATAQLAGAARTIRVDRRNLQALRSMLTSNGPQLTKIAASERQLLTAESVDISAAQRSTLLAVVLHRTQRLFSGINLPGASITLTSTKGQIPLTVLADPGLRATVVLRLQSQRLIFRPFSPHCQIPLDTMENCTVTLTAQNTTLKVPVETRSSGVFPLQVELWSPDGSLELLQHRVTVRSTAVSGVGIVLIVLAVVSLAVWWGRDLHHGRRARQLVPAPADDPADDSVERPVSAREEKVPVPATHHVPGDDRHPKGRHFRAPPSPPG